MTDEQQMTLPSVEKSDLMVDGFIKIRHDLLKHSNGYRQNYYTLVTKAPAVIVLAPTREGYFILSEEYRHPTGQVLLCCPGGYLEKDEDPIEGAKREFLEETGYSAEEFTLMGSAFAYPGISDQKLYYVLGKNAFKASEPGKDEGEVIQTVKKSLKEITRLIAEGEEIDGTMCTALFFYMTYEH